MTPIKISFYVYANGNGEANELETVLREFVEAKRQKGIAVTASALATAIKKYGNNFFVTNYLANGKSQAQ